KTRIEIEGTNVIKNSSIQNGSNSIKFNINLSNNINMDDQGANSIFESIIKCQRLNQFSVKIKQNLLKIKIIILTLIFQSDCQIGAQGIKGVTNILQKYNTINLLNAFLSNSKIDVEGINFDKNYIQSGSDKIKFNISLSNSIKMDEQSINDVIQAIQNNSNLYQLRLKSVDSNVGNIGVNSISSLIKKYGNVTQLSACLSNSKVSVEGTNIMVNNIQNNQKSIQFNIDLCIDFHIGTQRANSIMEAIKNCQKLTKMSLKLIDCNIGIQGVNGISSIIKKYENVTQIGFCLSKTRIHIEGSNIVNDNINNDASIKFNVDLSDNSIGAQGFKSITDTILNCKSVKKLDVHLFGDYYLIGVEGIRTLTKEKQNCENITELSLKLINCNFGLDGANLIADVINNYSSVTQFSLSLSLLEILTDKDQFNFIFFKNFNSENNIGIDEVQIIANAIKNFKSITELDLKLKKNKFAVQAVELVAEALPNDNLINNFSLLLKQFSYFCISFSTFNLQKTKISDQTIEMDGIQSLAQSIKKFKNTSKLAIDLRLFFQTIFQYLRNQFILLIYLIFLSSDCSINDSATKIFAQALNEYQKVIQFDLNLSDCPVGLEGASSIADTISQYKNVVQMNLNLSKNQIKAEGAEKISKALQSIENITKLSLSLCQNNIGEAGVLSISNAIRNYQNIQDLSLDLRINQIGDEGAVSIAQALQNYQKITQLTLLLSSNSIGTQGSKSIANAISNYQHIKKLNLDFSAISTSIGSEGANSLISVIKKYQNMNCLIVDFRQNNIVDDFKTDLEKSLKGTKLQIYN
ncbi:hypothetical protein ABPG73_007540, partial [Tetrahymena malaccensis]